MDEKIMEILAQLLQGQAEIKAAIHDMLDDLSQMISNLSQTDGIMASMENNLSSRLDALIEFSKEQQNVNAQILGRLDRIEAKIDRLLEPTYVCRVKLYRVK